MAHCMAFGCTSCYPSDNVSFHRLPENDDTKKAWIDRLTFRELPDEDVENSTVCSLHFEDSDYHRDLRSYLTGCQPKKALKQEAVPSKLKFNKPLKVFRPAGQWVQGKFRNVNLSDTRCGCSSVDRPVMVDTSTQCESTIIHMPTAIQDHTYMQPDTVIVKEELESSLTSAIHDDEPTYIVQPDSVIVEPDPGSKHNGSSMYTVQPEPVISDDDEPTRMQPDSVTKPGSSLTSALHNHEPTHPDSVIIKQEPGFCITSDSVYGDPSYAQLEMSSQETSCSFTSTMYNNEPIPVGLYMCTEMFNVQQDAGFSLISKSQDGDESSYMQSNPVIVNEGMGSIVTSVMQDDESPYVQPASVIVKVEPGFRLTDSQDGYQPYAQPDSVSVKQEPGSSFTITSNTGIDDPLRMEGHRSWTRSAKQPQRQKTSRLDDNLHGRKSSTKRKRAYLQRIKDNPDIYKIYKEYENNRIKVYKLNLSDEKKAAYKAASTRRMKRWRAKQRENKYKAPNNGCTSPKNGHKAPKTSDEKESTRAKWREDKRKTRAKMSEEAKEQNRQKRRARYKMTKAASNNTQAVTLTASNKSSARTKILQ